MRQLDKGPVELDAHKFFEQQANHSLDYLHHIAWLDERHLHIELGKLGLAIGAQIFIAETLDDLEISVEPADHENLLEQLRRLRQRIEFAVVDATRN